MHGSNHELEKHRKYWEANLESAEFSTLVWLSAQMSFDTLRKLWSVSRRLTSREQEIGCSGKFESLAFWDCASACRQNRTATRKCVICTNYSRVEPAAVKSGVFEYSGTYQLAQTPRSRFARPALEGIYPS
jgi:hypothetical protein